MLMLHPPGCCGCSKELEALRGSAAAMVLCKLLGHEHDITLCHHSL